MLRTINPRDLLVIDIETAPRLPSPYDLPERETHAWEKKHPTESLDEGVTQTQHFMRQAALHAEFGRIVCIAIGKLGKLENIFRVKTIASINEADILNNFFATLKKLGASAVEIRVLQTLCLARFAQLYPRN